MDNHQENHEETQKLVNAVGAIAEMSLVFYRAALGSGASPMEAERLTQAYIAAITFGSQNRREETP